MSPYAVHDLEDFFRLGLIPLDRLASSNDSRRRRFSYLALSSVVDADGEERQVMRFNMPFGRVGAGEFGTYVIGYVREPAVMLENMFVGMPPATPTGSSTSRRRSPATSSSRRPFASSTMDSERIARAVLSRLDRGAGGDRRSDVSDQRLLRQTFGGRQP